MCNLRSISKAIDACGYDFELVSKPEHLAGASHCVLPGVGAFAQAMSRLSGAGLTRAVRDFAAAGRPVLGICLGMQLLAEKGDEGGATQGLGLVPGHVVRLEPGGALRIPHVGWNTVALERPHPIFARVKPSRDFYFVHSYQLTRAGDAALGATEYGVPFTSVVDPDNRVG